MNFASAHEMLQEEMLQKFGALPAEQRAVVLAEMDAIIENKTARGRRCSSSLIDKSKRRYIYHPAVALSATSPADASRQRWCSKGWRSSRSRRLVGTTRSNLRFGTSATSSSNSPALSVSGALTAGGSFRTATTANALGLVTTSASESTASSTSCPACWPRHRVKALRAAEREEARARRDAARARREAKPKPTPRARQYSKKVQTWKAAYDALREMGVDIEEETAET